MDRVLRRIWQFIHENPLPILALVGLISGLVSQFGSGRADIATNIWLVTLTIGGIPIIITTLKGILHGRLAADVVAMLAIITALFTEEYFAGVIIVLMQTGGEALERYSLHRASSSLQNLLARAPRTAQRKTDSHIEDIEVEQVQIGDTLVVRPGDLIPVDGILLSPQADVDEAALTGEPLSTGMLSGASLLSGSINVGEVFEMRATHVSTDSTYAQMVTLVRQAQQEKPALQRLADMYAVWLTPATLILCVLGWLITGQLSTILAVLVVATPCPLILAVPVAIISGINRAATYGIIVKGGTAIEQVGRAQAVVFDKTGTLTFGTPHVQDVISLDGIDSQEILRLAGGVEQASAHVLAQTLGQAALRQYGTLPMPTHMHEVAGHGVEGEIEGHQVIVGSQAFLAERLHTAIPKAMDVKGDLATYVAIDRCVSGVITFSDELRPGVSELMRRLRALGVKHLVMLTGDRSEHAAAIARQAGVDAFVSGLLPEGKVKTLKNLMAHYDPIVMVGDGINDAPALATATVGVAMGAHGTGISAEAADIVLLVDDVTRVADAIDIGQCMVRVAKQSVFIGLGLSFVLMVIAMFGRIPPPVGAMLQEVIDVAVILNALRARSVKSA